jgi:nitroreductase/dihydropteridine reductase
MQLLEGLKWRYATKKFDRTKKIGESDLNAIKEAVQLSASSYGLQLYKVLFITNPEVREQLKAVAFGQPQITDASHLVVFCNYSNLNDDHVDEYIENIAKTRSMKFEDLQDFGKVMKGSINAKSSEMQDAWTAKQTYIALGTLLAATSEMKIDACPMEGFNAAEFNKILGLEKQNLNAAVIATIGYRSEDDGFQHLKKVRRPESQLFEDIT